MAKSSDDRDDLKKLSKKETNDRLKAGGLGDRPIYADLTVTEMLGKDEPEAPVVTPGGYGTSAATPAIPDPPSGIDYYGDSPPTRESIAALGVEGSKMSMPRAVEEEPDDFLGKALKTYTDIFPDHLGDNLRGDKGWFSDVPVVGPVYRNTVGAVFDTAFEVGGNVIDAIYWGSEQSGHALALGYSYLPGGMDPLEFTWGGFESIENGGGFQGDVTKISTGRAGYAALASPIAEFADEEELKIRSGGAFTVAAGALLGPPAILAGAAAIFDPDNPIFTMEGQKNILDEDVQEEIFSNPLLGIIGSGTADFMWDIFGDPTIVGGKATSIIRYGTRAGRFSGLSNQSLANPTQVKRFGDRIDEGLKIQEDAVTAGSVPGRTTAEFEHVKSLVDAPDAYELTQHVFVKNSNDPDAVMRLAQQIQPGDYKSGAALVKALAGEASGWRQLSEAAPGVYDDLYRTVTGGADLFDAAARGAAMTPMQVTQGGRMMREAKDALDVFDLRMADDATQKGIVDGVDEAARKARIAEDPYVAGQILTRGGTRFSPLARGGDAWRSGKARGRWGSPKVTEVGDVGLKSGQAGWVARKIQATSASRGAIFIRWAGSGRPTNIVHLKGGDGVNASTEVQNWLLKSSIKKGKAAQLFDEFVNEATVEGRRNKLLEMERAEVEAVAAKLGLETDQVMKAYQSYNSMRGKKLWEVRKTADEARTSKGDEIFTVDEQGNQVHVAGLYSELDEAFPLLDTIEFNRVVKANKGSLAAKGYNYGLTRGGEIGDIFNNMWKVSVLLRLGYTARNITEGALRSVAVMGTLAANPQALARVPRSAAYRVARRKAHGKRGKITVQSKAVDDALADLMDARRTLDEWTAASGAEAKFRAEKRVKDAEELLAQARIKANARPHLDQRDKWISDNRLPIDDEIDEISKGLDQLKKDFELAEIKLAGGSGTKQQLGEIQKKINREVGKLETRVARREVQANKAYDKRVKELDAEQTKARKEVTRLEAKVAAKKKDLEEAQAVLDKNIETELPPIQNLLAQKAKNVDEKITQLRKMQASLERKRTGKKGNKGKKVGMQGNVVGKDANGNDIIYDGAFMGSDGDIARLLASADNTYQQVFNTGYTTRAREMKMSDQWQVLDPSEIRTVEKMTEYWDQYTLMLNRRMRNDPIISRWLARGDDEAGLIEDTVRYLMQGDQKTYTGTLRTQQGEKLVDEGGNAIRAQVEKYVNQTYYRYSTEIPPNMGLRQALSEGQITPDQLKTAYGNQPPPKIATPVEMQESNGFPTALNGIQTVTGWAMKWLGTIPENALLRHPFYESVYRTEQLRLARLAADSGADLLAPATRSQINGSARRVALKETRKTMYTIERQSNASNALRFFAPFFAAWENSIRTWGRIAYQNPAVVGAGALMWNIPNSMGWIVDEKGNKVEYSNFLREDQETYMVYPPQVANALAKLNRDIGPVNTTAFMPFIGNFIPPQDEDGNALTTRTRQQGLNVIFPGGLLDSSTGPIMTIPTSLMLRGKPEITEALRESMGDDLFNNFVPLGNPNTPVSDQLFPTVVKRVKNYTFGGEDENTAYLRLKNTMIQDELVKAELEGRRVTNRDMERVMKNADKFYRWTIGTAVTSYTASTSYQSEFAVERGYWRTLQEQNIPYGDKVDKFIAKFGTEYLPVTRTTSQNRFKLGYSQHTYERAMQDPELMEDISRNLGDEYVGMFSNVGDIESPFSYSVYGEYPGMRIDDKRVLTKMTPAEIVESNDISEYWRKRAMAKDQLDAQAKDMGLPGADSLDDYDEIMDLIEADLVQQHPGIQGYLDKGYDPNRVDKTIKVSRMIVETADDYGDGSNPTIMVLEEYLLKRDYFTDAIAMVGDDADAKRELKKLAMADVAALRDKDIGFADFYDKHLEDDDFREVE